MKLGVLLTMSSNGRAVVNRMMLEQIMMMLMISIDSVQRYSHPRIVGDGVPF